MSTEVGIIEAGKYPDPAGFGESPRDYVENTLSIRDAMKGGRLYAAGR